MTMILHNSHTSENTNKQTDNLNL